MLTVFISLLHIFTKIVINKQLLIKDTIKACLYLDMCYIARFINQYLFIMRKILLLLIGVLVTGNMLWAGGLVTNTNQSTAWARMLARDASVDIDAVFYNPAGLVKLQDGFHISINSQTLWQKQTINSAFPYLNDPTYEGDVFAPVFPSIYMAWKKGKLAVSFAFNPIGGGGGATFERGLPSMEIPIAGAAAQFAPLGVTGYSADMLFEGSSVYWGLQLGVSYAITENISVFAGARYVMAKNTYQGYLRDIQFQTAGGEVRADDFMNGVSQQLAEGAIQLTNTAAMMEPYLAAYGALTFDQVIAATAGDPALQGQVMALRDGLTGLGVSDAGSMSLTGGHQTYLGYAEGYTAQSAQMSAGAFLMQDQEADVVQTGSGITPILGLNLSFLEDKFNIGVKYEFKTKMDLTNATDKDFITGIDPATGDPITMFPDGAITNADIPAMLSIGIGYQIIEPVTLQLGYHTYFDKAAGWATDENGIESIDKNFSEYAIGLEWALGPKFRLSGGYLLAITGVNENYQSDLSFSLTTNTFGYGFAWDLGEAVTLQFGGFVTSYNDDSYNKNYSGINYTETYDKFTYALSLGLDIKLGGNKE